MTAFSLAWASASFCIVSSSSAVASANSFFLGSTMTETWWYLCMARTHMHMAVHALLAFWTWAGVKASISIYGPILSMIFVGMLSLSYSFILSINFPPRLSSSFWADLK